MKVKCLACSALFLLSATAMSVSAQDMASPPNSLVVDDLGNVGVGTDAPNAPLEVVRSDGSAKVLVTETGAAGAQQMFSLALTGPGRPRFAINNNANSWTFDVTFGGDFTFSRLGTGVFEAILDGAGNLDLRGALTQNSSRTVKTEITSVDTQEVLSKVLALTVAEWQYKHDQPGIRHIGPMAEDFYTAFGVGKNEKGIASLDTAGVALAAIQGLNEKLEQKDARIEELEHQLAELRQMVYKLATENKTALNQ